MAELLGTRLDLEVMGSSPTLTSKDTCRVVSWQTLVKLLHHACK